MICNSMTCFRLYKYAKETRDAQKQYFRTRDTQDLRTAKALERELDKAIDNYARVVLNSQPPQPTQPTLFSRECGDCAKLRAALKLCMDELCDRCRDLASARGNPLPCLNGCEPVRKAKAALAAPPRNCDMPLVVDGPADNNADKAWLVFKRHNPDAYFDVSGLLRCIDWLLAPATEKEGVVK